MTRTVYTEFSTPVGVITLSATDKALTGLWIAGQRHFGRTLLPSAQYTLSDYTLDLGRRWLDSYFRGCAPGIDLPLAPEGTGFQQCVWRTLLKIPYGSTATYREIADEVARLTGRRPSPRAVGTAIGHNPISILIPCHRVIRSDGSLGGYAAGTSVKEFLLRLETGR